MIYEVAGEVRGLDAQAVYIDGERPIIGALVKVQVKVPYIGKNYNTKEPQQMFDDVMHQFFVAPTEIPPSIGDKVVLTMTVQDLSNDTDDSEQNLDTGVVDEAV